MRPPRALTVAALALLVAACGSAGPSATSTAGPAVITTAPGITAPPESQPPCVDPASCNTELPASNGRVLVIRGTFSGHFSDPLATADQTVDVEFLWHVGPDDIHDRDAFTFTSGSYTFSESIGGVCGGTRTEAGLLQPQGNQSLISGDPQDRDLARVSMIDRRITDGFLEFSLFSNFGVPNPDAEGCGPLSRSGVGSCSLKFPQLAADRLQADATCTNQAGTTWTGHLEQ